MPRLQAPPGRGGATRRSATDPGQARRSSDRAQGSIPQWEWVARTCVLSYGSVILYFYYTAWSTTLLFIHIHVGAGLLMVVDSFTSMVFLLEFMYRGYYGGKEYFFSFLGLIDLLAWPGGLLHAYVGGEGAVGKWVRASCVLRVLKPERYCGAFRDCYVILLEHSPLQGHWLHHIALLDGFLHIALPIRGWLA